MFDPLKSIKNYGLKDKNHLKFQGRYDDMNHCLIVVAIFILFDIFYVFIDYVMVYPYEIS